MFTSARLPELAVGRRTPPPLVSHDHGRTVIWLSGEYRILPIGLLRDTLTGVISDHDTDVVVDLQRVTFIDAANTGALLDGREALDRQSRRFALRSPSTRAMHVLTICELTALVESTPSLPHERTREKR